MRPASQLTVTGVALCHNIFGDLWCRRTYMTLLKKKKKEEEKVVSVAMLFSCCILILIYKQKFVNYEP